MAVWFSDVVTWDIADQSMAFNETDCNGELYVTQFLPRDATCQRCLCCRPVSVCLSVCHVGAYCIHTAEDIVKLLFRPDSPIILVFWPQSRYPIPRGTLSAGAQNTRWIGKFCDFRLKSPSISKTVRYGCYGTLIGSPMRSIVWCHTQWPWRTPNPVFKVTAFLKLNISSIS